MMNLIFNWLLSKAKDYLFANWKTTLVGWIAAGLNIAHSKGWVPSLDMTTVNAVLVAIFALFSKDGDKTGTAEQPRTAPEIVAVQNERAEIEKMLAAGG